MQGSLWHLHLFQEAQAYADDNSLLFMETSAKTAMNVNDLFLAIGETLAEAWAVGLWSCLVPQSQNGDCSQGRAPCPAAGALD